MAGTRRSTRKAPAAEAETEDIKVQEPAKTMKTRQTRTSRIAAATGTSTTPATMKSKARSSRAKKNAALPVEEEDEIEQEEGEKESEDAQTITAPKTKGRAGKPTATAAKPRATKGRASKAGKEVVEEEEGGVAIIDASPAPASRRSMRSMKSATAALSATTTRRSEKNVTPRSTAHIVLNEGDGDLSDEDSRAIGKALKKKGRGVKNGVTQKVIAKKPGGRKTSTLKGRATRGKNQTEPEENIEMDEERRQPTFGVQVVIFSPPRNALAKRKLRNTQPQPEPEHEAENGELTKSIEVQPPKLSEKKASTSKRVRQSEPEAEIEEQTTQKKALAKRVREAKKVEPETELELEEPKETIVVHSHPEKKKTAQGRKAVKAGISSQVTTQRRQSKRRKKSEPDSQPEVDAEEPADLTVVPHAPEPVKKGRTAWRKRADPEVEVQPKPQSELAVEEAKKASAKCERKGKQVEPGPGAKGEIEGSESVEPFQDTDEESHAPVTGKKSPATRTKRVEPEVEASVPVTISGEQEAMKTLRAEHGKKLGISALVPANTELTCSKAVATPSILEELVEESNEKTMETVELDTEAAEAKAVDLELDMAEPHIAVPEAEMAEPDAKSSETEAEIAEPDAMAAEPEANNMEPEAEIAEAEIAEPEAKIAEPGAMTIEPEANIVELEAKAAEPEVEIAEPDAMTPDPETEIAEPEPEAEIAEPEPEAEIAEPEAKIAEPDAMNAEPEANIVELEAKAVGPEAEIAEPDAMALYLETEIAEPEPEAKIAEPGAMTTEPEANIVEPEAEVAEPQIEIVESDEKTVELEWAEREGFELQTAEPEETSPEKVVLEVGEPETMEPRAANPGEVEPEATEPVVAEPKATKPEAAESETTELEVAERSASEEHLTDAMCAKVHLSPSGNVALNVTAVRTEYASFPGSSNPTPGVEVDCEPSKAIEDIASLRTSEEVKFMNELSTDEPLIVESSDVESPKGNPTVVASSNDKPEDELSDDENSLAPEPSPRLPTSSDDMDDETEYGSEADIENSHISLHSSDIFPSSFEGGGRDIRSSPVKLPSHITEDNFHRADDPQGVSEVPPTPQGRILATPSRRQSIWASDPVLGTPVTASTPIGRAMMTPNISFGSPMVRTSFVFSPISDSPVKSPAKPSTPIKVFSPATGGSSKSVRSVAATPSSSSVLEDGHRFSQLSPATSNVVAGKGRSPVKNSPEPGQLMSSPLGLYGMELPSTSPRKRPHDEISSDGFNQLFATPVADSSAPKRQLQQASSPAINLASLPSPILSPSKPRTPSLASRKEGQPRARIHGMLVDSSAIRQTRQSALFGEGESPRTGQSPLAALQDDSPIKSSAASDQPRPPGYDSLFDDSFSLSPVKISFIGLKQEEREEDSDAPPGRAERERLEGFDSPFDETFSPVKLPPIKVNDGPTPTSSPRSESPEQQLASSLESSSPFEENVPPPQTPIRSPKQKLTYVKDPLAGVDEPSTPEKRLRASVEEAPDSITQGRCGRQANPELSHKAVDPMVRLRALARGYLVRKHTEALRKDTLSMTGSGILDSFIKKHEAKSRFTPKSSLPVPKASVTSKIPRAVKAKAPNASEVVYLPPVDDTPISFSPLTSATSATSPSSPRSSPRTRKRSAEDFSDVPAKKQAVEGVRRSGRAAVKPPTISLAPAAPRPVGPLTWDTMLERERKELVKKNTSLNCMPTPHKRQIERKPIPRPPSPTAALQTKAAAERRQKRTAHFLETGIELGPGESPSSGFVPKDLTPPKRGVRWGAPLETGNGSDAETYSPLQTKTAGIDSGRLVNGSVALDKFGNLEGASPPRAGTSPVVIKKVLYKGEKG